MPNTVPNQKTVLVSKSSAKGKIFAQIEMSALEKAAQTLDAGAFKPWIYFVKNQDGFEFALSGTAVEEYFGMKKAQYDNAVHTLIEKGYLKCLHGNHYLFSDNPKVKEKAETVVSKTNHETASQKVDISKNDHALYQKETTSGNEKAQEILYDNKKIVIENSLASQENPQADSPKLKEIQKSLIPKYFAGFKYTIKDDILTFADDDINHGGQLRVIPDSPELEVITIESPHKRGYRY